MDNQDYFDNQIAVLNEIVAIIQYQNDFAKLNNLNQETADNIKRGIDAWKALHIFLADKIGTYDDGIKKYAMGDFAKAILLNKDEGRMAAFQLIYQFFKNEFPETTTEDGQ